MLVRLWAAVVAMEVAALLVALWTFGWPVLLVGVPLLVGTLILFAVVRLSEGPRRRLRSHRATRSDPTWSDPDGAVPGGLMSGFFEPVRW